MFVNGAGQFIDAPSMQIVAQWKKIGADKMQINGINKLIGIF